jgi:hypothetical protein
MKQENHYKPAGNTQPASKSGVLGPIIFIGVIILIAWFSVQLVNKTPGPFSSLASLVESLRSEDGQTMGTITITNEDPLINAGNPFTINWSQNDRPGTYTFMYDCAEGVAIDLIESETRRSISCDTNYDIGDTNTLSIAIDSEKKRYTDVLYTIGFLATNDTTPRAQGTSTITVMNQDVSVLATNTVDTPSEELIPTPEVAGEEKESEILPETIIESESPAIEVEESPIITEPEVEPTQTHEVEPTPAPEVTEYVFTYTPTSDPNGGTDLGVKYVSSGSINNNTYLPGIIDNDEAGAIQFEVRNYGTKTSGDWYYTVSLPNGDEYVSPAQTGLRPNERATLSLGFPAPKVSSHTFVVQVTEASDYSPLNNQMVQTLSFAN